MPDPGTIAFQEWLRAFPDCTLDTAHRTTWVNGQIRGPALFPCSTPDTPHPVPPSHASGCVEFVGSGKTATVMFVLHRAGQWFAGLFRAFDDALVALDDDIDVPNLGR